MDEDELNPSVVAGKAKADTHKRRYRSVYPFNKYADICYYGDGVGCDGGDCWCTCHSEHAPHFDTNEQVAEWHSDD